MPVGQCVRRHFIKARIVLNLNLMDIILFFFKCIHLNSCAQVISICCWYFYLCFLVFYNIQGQYILCTNREISYFVKIPQEQSFCQQGHFVLHKNSRKGLPQSLHESLPQPLYISLTRHKKTVLPKMWTGWKNHQIRISGAEWCNFILTTLGETTPFSTLTENGLSFMWMVFKYQFLKVKIISY